MNASLDEIKGRLARASTATPRQELEDLIIRGEDCVELKRKLASVSINTPRHEVEDLIIEAEGIVNRTHEDEDESNPKR